MNINNAQMLFLKALTVALTELTLVLTYPGKEFRYFSFTAI